MSSTKRSVSKGNVKHGMKRTRFYQVWADMKRRCTNPRATGYANYGGRGIQVCARWVIFENFRDDMYASYLTHADAHGEEDTTLERKDVHGSYSHENCLWVTKAEQNRNKRNVIEAVGVQQGSEGSWRAQFQRKGIIHGKSFPTKEQAIEWRKSAVKEYDSHDAV